MRGRENHRRHALSAPARNVRLNRKGSSNLKITRLSQRLLTLDEVLAMKDFRLHAAKENFACLSEDIFMIIPGDTEDVQELLTHARKAFRIPMTEGNTVPYAFPLNNDRTLIHLYNQRLYIITDETHSDWTLVDFIPYIHRAREAWQEARILALCTGRDSSVDISCDDVQTRFTGE